MIIQIGCYYMFHKGLLKLSILLINFFLVSNVLVLNIIALVLFKKSVVIRKMHKKDAIHTKKIILVTGHRRENHGQDPELPCPCLVIFFGAARCSPLPAPPLP